MKALCLIDTNEDVKRTSDKMSELKETFNQRVKFLRKQIDDEMEKADTAAKEVWEELETHLHAKNIFPPGYSKKTHSLTIDRDAGVLFIYEKSEEKKNEGVRGLLKFFGIET